MSDSEEDGAFESADEGDAESTKRDKQTEKNLTKMAAKKQIAGKEKHVELKQSKKEASKSGSPSKDTTQISSGGNNEKSPSSKSDEGNQSMKVAKDKSQISEEISERKDLSAESLAATVSPPSDTTLTAGSSEQGETASSASDASEVKTRERTPTRKIERKVKDDIQKTEHTDDEQNILEKLSGAAKKSTSWGWGWGSNLLSTATSSVSTFTSQVGEGLTAVIESADSAFGAPKPEDLVEDKQQTSNQDVQERGDEKASSESRGTETVGDTGKAEVITKPPDSKKEENEGDEKKGATGGTDDEEAEPEPKWFSAIGAATSWGLSEISTVVQQTSNVVQHTSKTLVTGGLDVLETIGKKTYDVIAEGDHGLKKTIRGSQRKINLSQLLREAKDDADMKLQTEKEFEETRKSHFGAQFDDFQGLVQLEALEMLSNQCEGRVMSLLSALSGDQLELTKKELITIKETFEMEDVDTDEEEKEQDFEKLLTDYIGQLGLSVTADRLIQVNKKIRTRHEECKQTDTETEKKTIQEIHQRGIQSLAEFTARSVEQFHKIGQLTLLDKTAPLTSFKTKAETLANITRVLCTELGIMSGKFCEYLNTTAEGLEDSAIVNPLITGVYLETTNSNTYVQDSFQLLLPVLQQATLEAHARLSHS